MGLEDWFAQLCPEVEPVDFSPLPKCARGCLEDGSFANGCVTGGRNCFCAMGELFECEKNCGKQKEWDSIAQWLVKECGASLEEAEAGVQSGSFTITPTLVGEAKTPTAMATETRRVALNIISKGRPPPTWYEIIAITVAAISLAAGVVLWKGYELWNMWRKRGMKH
jgi:hypothetical protein